MGSSKCKLSHIETKLLLQYGKFLGPILKKQYGILRPIWLLLGFKMGSNMGGIFDNMGINMGAQYGNISPLVSLRVTKNGIMFSRQRKTAGVSVMQVRS